MVTVTEIKNALKELAREDPYFLRGLILDVISEDLMTKDEFAKVFEKLATKEDLKMLIEMFNKRFEDMNKRFEDMQKYMERRFEAIDKRFEDLQRYMDKRFEDINKRFEDMRYYLDKRFESLERRIGLLERLNLTILTGIIALLIKIFVLG